ncbi:MAG: hypothetical protein P4L81_05940 [Candidatus Pacebacteria bacterium]|nr:hypothetical protein [Candidatus Paceibacterota bacterium]
MDWDWLGTGVYFWVENYRMAELWGKKIERENVKNEKSMILKCQIGLGECLNLADRGNVWPFSKFCKQLSEIDEFANFKKNMPGGTGHPLEGESVYRHFDHRLIDEYDSALGVHFDTILGVFENGKPIVDGSDIYRYNSVQLAVRKKALDNIKILGTGR